MQNTDLNNFGQDIQGHSRLRDCYRPQPFEVIQWASRTLDEAQAARETKGYLPRFQRVPEAARHVPIVGILGLLDQDAASSVMSQAQSALRPLPLEVRRGIRFLDPDVAHLSFQWVPGGNTRQEDLHNLRQARAEVRPLQRFLQNQPPFSLVIDGLTASDKQIMATCRVNDSWHDFVQASADWGNLSRCFRVPYDPAKGPLEQNGRLLQVTIAVFDDGLPMGEIAEALRPQLPANKVFDPVALELDTLSMTVTEYDLDYVQRISEVLCTASVGASRETGLKAADLQFAS